MSANGHIQTSTDALQLLQIKTLDELIGVWPFVKRGIEHIKDRDKTCGSWTTSQIFNAIKFGLPTMPQKTTATELFVALDQTTKLKAFMVTTPRLDPFLNNSPCGIHVWLLYANREMVKQFLPQLEQLGKIHGGQRITFESGRPEWLGRWGRAAVKMFESGWMGKLGFRIHQFVFVKDIKW